jgi:hypothetical protein
MRLAELPVRLIDDWLKTWRRRAIAGVVIALCGIIAAIEALAAMRLALELALGPVGARLVLAGAFVAIAVATVLALGRIEAAARTPAPEQEPRSQDERVSMIAEAINLGYMAARDLRKSSAAPAADRPQADDDAPAEPARPRNGAHAERRAADR